MSNTEVDFLSVSLLRHVRSISLNFFFLFLSVEYFYFPSFPSRQNSITDVSNGPSETLRQIHIENQNKTEKDEELIFFWRGFCYCFYTCAILQIYMYSVQTPGEMLGVRLISPSLKTRHRVEKTSHCGIHGTCCSFIFYF